jgi:hypothetical protein
MSIKTGSTETPTQRRSKQMDHLSATALDLAHACNAAAQEDSKKPLGQKDRAKFKKQVEQKVRTINSLLEGVML